MPVGGISELKTAYDENNEEIKYVVLVNCGGTIDLVDILQPEEDVVFFVLDSHKPTDICNVYSDGQVCDSYIISLSLIYLCHFHSYVSTV